MRWLLLCLLVVLAVGCAHGAPLFAFPVTGGGGDDEAKPPETSQTDTAVPSVLRTPLVARATRDDVVRVTCGLRPLVAVGAQSRPLDLHVDGRPCAQPSPNGIRANVDGYRGVVELEVPQGTTPEEAGDLQRGLVDVSNELARRLRMVPPQVVVAPASTAPVVEQKTGKRSSRWFLSAGILGAIGLVTLGVGGAMAASNDQGVQSVGETLMLATALPVGVGAAVTAVVALILLATERTD